MNDGGAMARRASFEGWRKRVEHPVPMPAAPADPAQRRLWFLEQVEPGQARYNCPHALVAQGPLPAVAIEQAFGLLARRHEALRSSFFMDDAGELRRLVAAPSRPAFSLLDLSGLSEPRDQVQPSLRHLLARPFDLEQGPLWRAGCIRIATDEHIVYLSAHHAIVDDWSMRVLLRELAALLEAALAGIPLLLPQPAATATGTQATRQPLALDYWKSVLTQVPVLLLPTDRPRQANPPRTGAKVFRRLASGLTNALDARTREYGISAFAAYLTAFRCVLATWSGQDDFAIGVPAFDRDSPDVENRVGLAVNLLALRRDAVGEHKFWPAAVREFNGLLEGLEHRYVPFEEVVEAVMTARVAGTDPLVQVMYSHHERAEARFSAGHCHFSPLDVVLPHARFELTLMTVRVDGELSISVEYDADLFEAVSIDSMLDNFMALLERVIADEDPEWAVPVAHPALLTAEPADMLLRPLAQRLRQHFSARPDAVALHHDSGNYSFRWLGVRAEGIACALRERGAGCDSIIAIVIRRGPLQVTGLCGTVLAGAAFSLLDPDAPTERLYQLIETIAPKLILVSRDGPALALPPGFPVLELESLRPATIVGPDPAFSPESLAYVVATSGSTGRCKVVGAPHRGLINRIDWMARIEPWQPGDRALSRTQTMFVDFICEVMAPLSAGVALVMAEPSDVFDGEALLTLIGTGEVTQLVATPSLLRQLAVLDELTGACGVRALRVVVSSGEALAPEDVRAIRQLAPGARLWNLYGSSEVAADACGACVDDDRATVSIGVPIDGMTLWVADREGRAVPWRSPGELHISGPGLARGYLGDPAATARAYRPALFGGVGARGFASGDYARIDTDGNLCFAGRAGGRVDVRGLRVEIHEMEAILRADPEVVEVAVVVVEGPRRSVARVVSRGPAVDLHGLRRRLLARVPAYLVPDMLESGDLPRTASGKVDYVALQALRRETTSEGMPGTPMELALAQAWSEVLGVVVVDRGADFFALGGHSLAAARISRMLEQRLQRRVPAALMLVSPRLHDAAVMLEKQDGVGTPAIAASPALRFDPFELHPLQAAYLAGRGGAFEGGGVSIHGYTEIEIGEVTVDQFENALNVLVERHDMLRAVVLDDGRQQVLRTVPHYRVERIDLRGLSSEAVEARRAVLRGELSVQVLDLRRWPSFDIRATLADDSAPRLHISFDAIFVDAWSQTILLRELVRILRDGDPLWQRPQLMFRDYLETLRSNRSALDHERAWADWRARLSSMPLAPQLPVAETTPGNGPLQVAQLIRDVAPEVVEQLRARVGRDGNLVTVLLAAFAVVLRRWAASPQFMLNVPISGRSLVHEDIEHVVGPFGDFTFLAFDLVDLPSFGDLVRATRRELTWALERQAVTGMDLARELMTQRGFQLLAPIVFTSLNFDAGADIAPAESLFHEICSASQTPQVHLDSRVRLQSDGSVRISWDIATAMFPMGMPEAMLAAYGELLETAAGISWDQPLQAWPGDPPVPVQAASTLETCLGERFWSWAAHAPQLLAVACRDGEWTYGELAGRAAAIARDLLSRGIGRGDIVAVALEKGPLQLAAVLGILRTGAAYAPLDPEHPSERLSELMQSLAACAAVVEAPYANAAWLGQAQPIIATLFFAPEPDLALPPSRAQPTDLAYVIHTSGSTGRPKGVMISRAAAWTTVSAVNQRLGLNEKDRVLALSALGFDLSVWDIFGPLSAGAAVVVPVSGEARDPGAWLRLAGESGVTIWNSAPGLMGAALERGGQGLQALRWALLSGDFIPLGMPGRVRQVAPSCQVLSLGGATEAAIWSVWREVGEVQPGWRSIPYGTALPGQQMYVLDAKFQLCPPWVDGEIVIGGAGLALGYWDNPGETAIRFVAHPRTGQRLYRTGDRGRLRGDGDIEILGRVDRQVKVNGHRIEPGEIEAALLSNSDVAHCIVSLDRNPGGEHLVAHIVRRKDVPVPVPAVAQVAAVQTARRAFFALARVDLGVTREELAARACGRRSRRAFLPAPIRRRALGSLLLSLRQCEDPRTPLPQRQYGSAGSLYQVNALVAVRPGAVAGLDAGYYFVDPDDVALVKLAPFDREDVHLIGAGNTLLFSTAAFAVLLVADLAFVRERYGDEAERFAAIEAGLMAQLLETEAPAHGIGLCQVGGVDAARVIERCSLDSGMVVLHALVGGAIDPAVEDPVADLYGWRADAIATSTWLQDRQCEEELRTRLEARLPRPMRPGRFVFWSQLPLTENGKVDHSALAATVAPARIGPPVAPAKPARHLAQPTPVAVDVEEGRLLALWRNVLQAPDVGVDDNFLALGGNSLQALRLLALVEEQFGRAPAVGDFLSVPTVSGLRHLIEKTPCRELAPRGAVLQQGGDPSEPFPLNPMQQAYAVSRAGVMSGFTRAARNYFEVDFEGLDLARLERAISRLIARHGMLRARFEPPNQLIPDTAPPYVLTVEDIGALTEPAAQMRLATLRTMMEERSTALSQWPLFDLLAVRLPGGAVRLHVGLDLLICDARSFQILHQDLMSYYEADADDALAPLLISFRDHAVAVEALRNGPRGAIDRAFWQSRIEGFAPPVRLPTLDADGRDHFGMFQRLSAQMDPERFARLRTLAASHGATASGVLCAAFSRVLAVWNGRSAFTINLTTFGREPIHPDVDQLVGEFTSSTLLEVNPDVADFATLAQATQRRILSDLEHRSFTGTEVLRLLNRQRGRIGDFEASVVFTSLVGVTLNSTPVTAGLVSRLVHAVSQTPQVLLDHQVIDIDGRLLFNWDFAADRFPEGVVEEMFTTYCAFVDRLVDDPKTWIDAL